MKIKLKDSGVFVHDDGIIVKPSPKTCATILHIKESGFIGWDFNNEGALGTKHGINSNNNIMRLDPYGLVAWAQDHLKERTNLLARREALEIELAKIDEQLGDIE